jgi:hypothetical protein
MKILFDELGKTIPPHSITDSIKKFKPSYTETVNAIIKRSENNPHKPEAVNISMRA